MATWSSVKLKGKLQVIPHVCPNCLGKTNRSYRYGYKGLKGWLTRTTYYQTFDYCQPCAKQAKSALGLGDWGFWLGFLGFIAFIAFLAEFVNLFWDAQLHKVPDKLVGVGIAAAVVAAVILYFLLYGLVRATKHRHFPLTEQQAVWGPAVFYTGSGVLDMQSQASYKAARREWLAELIKANPDQVSDETYQSFVGTAKPQVAKAKPFGAA